MNPNNHYADLPPGSGPDGASLLGFLASVGALVSFTTIYPDNKVTLHWEQSLGWRGRILIDGKPIGEDEITNLHAHLTDNSNEELFNLTMNNGNDRYQTITKVELSDVRTYLKTAIREGDKTKRNRLCSTYQGWFLDFVEGKAASSSKLCALTGGGKQFFLETALHLSGFHENRAARVTEKKHLESTLLEPWKYEEPMPGCLWDAQEDRQYALRHRDPTQLHKGERRSNYDGKVRTQRGANRLGIEALSVFPLMPKVKRAETPGFSKSRDAGHMFTWPIWETPLTLAPIRVLMSHPRLTIKEPNLAALSPLGVSAVFRVRRIVKNERQVSFTIAEPI